MADWVTEKTNEEILKKVKQEIEDFDILELVLGTEQIIEEGRFPHNILGTVVSLKKIIGKIKDGSRIKS
tara:strand:+ start:246 stop:452 length:207 start_codon:yes stop_codon:yes gene_type:complete